MKIGSPEEIRRLESSCGVSSEVLMENAGRAAAEELLRQEKVRRVAIICGPGNNGADGLVTARILREKGVSVQVYALEDLTDKLPALQCDWIVDALYGIGLDRPLRGEKIERVVNWIQQSNRPVVSLDAPSGLDCATGEAEGVAITARLTLTFGVSKIGFYTATGSELAGEVRVLDIGFPRSAVARSLRKYYLIEERFAARLIPRRPLSSNKTSFGHLGVCAGHSGFWGAGVLATQAAFRSGVGYVTWASETPPLEELKFHPEVLTSDLKSIFQSGKCGAFVVGPGLGVDQGTVQALESLRKTKRPAVIDADAITVLAKEKIEGLPSNWILTPHAGELSRLMGISSSEIDRDRFQAVTTAARKYGCLVLLKGYRTLIASPNKCVIIPTGNPALAKAGTGDVLAGLIGGFLAQGLSTWKAAILGAYLHGLLADEWLREGGDEAALVASDLAKTLPGVLAKLRARGQPRRRPT